MKVVLGSRGSKLALWQTNHVADLLRAAFPGLETEITIIHTKGDKILDVPLAQVGGKGLFVKEIEDALLDGRCDVAVHSLKDVPAELPEGLMLGAALPRELPWDAFICDKWASVQDLPQGARVGTSSLRRVSQLRAMRPDLDIVSLRGNVDTRLRKVGTELDGILLAAAGLRRLGLGDRIRQVLSPPDFIPAVGQGIVVVECRIADADTRAKLAALDHWPTRVAMDAERGFLAEMGGGCQVPLGAHATLDGDAVKVIGLVGRPDGTGILRDAREGTTATAEATGRALARALLDAGGREILDALEPLG